MLNIAWQKPFTTWSPTQLPTQLTLPKLLLCLLGFKLCVLAHSHHAAGPPRTLSPQARGGCLPLWPRDLWISHVTAWLGSFSVIYLFPQLLGIEMAYWPLIFAIYHSTRHRAEPSKCLLNEGMSTVIDVCMGRRGGARKGSEEVWWRVIPEQDLHGQARFIQADKKSKSIPEREESMDKVRKHYTAMCTGETSYNCTGLKSRIPEYSGVRWRWVGVGGASINLAFRQ